MANQKVSLPACEPTSVASTTTPLEIPVPAKIAAEIVGVSLPSLWRGVAEGRFPQPVYPAPRAPRWFPSEIRAALAATRALPADAKMARRDARIAAMRAEGAV